MVFYSYLFTIISFVPILLLGPGFGSLVSSWLGNRGWAVMGSDFWFHPGIWEIPSPWWARTTQSCPWVFPQGERQDLPVILRFLFILQECPTQNKARISWRQQIALSNYLRNSLKILLTDMKGKCGFQKIPFGMNSEFCFQSEMSLMFSTEARTAIYSIFQKLPRQGWW